MNDDRMACRGGDTVEHQRCGATFLECVECRKEVRWDLADHYFFGFQTCELAVPRPPAAPAPESPP